MENLNPTLRTRGFCLQKITLVDSIHGHSSIGLVKDLGRHPARHPRSFPEVVAACPSVLCGKPVAYNYVPFSINHGLL